MFFKDFAVARNSLQFFEDWASTYLAEHPLMTALLLQHRCFPVNIVRFLFEEHLPTAASVNKKQCIQANALHIFISNLSFLIKGLLAKAPKFTDGKIFDTIDKK